MKIILNIIEPDDAVIGVRAARWLIDQPDTQKDAILVYGDKPNEIVFYVKRNKASILARRIPNKGRSNA